MILLSVMLAGFVLPTSQITLEAFKVAYRRELAVYRKHFQRTHFLFKLPKDITFP